MSGKTDFHCKLNLGDFVHSRATAIETAAFSLSDQKMPRFKIFHSFSAELQRKRSIILGSKANQTFAVQKISFEARIIGFVFQILVFCRKLTPQINEFL